jgi:uncharacterized protein YjbI with pentapeptide repeats
MTIRTMAVAMLMAGACHAAGAGVLSDCAGSGFVIAGGNLSCPNLAGADLTGSSLVGISLAGAQLNGATFTGANLSWADFTGANLTDANLTGSNLFGGQWNHANITGIVLTGTGVTASQLLLLGAYVGPLAPAVPEPGNWVLLLAGLAMLGLFGVARRWAARAAGAAGTSGAAVLAA